jgi:predicted alpha/beta-fold hydrolase
MVHGLEGSGEAGYVRSLSGAALRAGFAAHRFHMRTCGGTERLCNTVYHAGLTSDLRFVLLDFQRRSAACAFLVGFSLGGNVVMKLAGEMGEEARPLIGGVCAVSAPLDLAKCARRISHPENRLYQRRFVRRMSERLSATGRYHKRDFAGVRSVMEIDDRITAPSFGFGNAANYYRTQSALPYLEGIRVPALLIHSKDDTMAPFESCEADGARANPRITLLATEHGGHLGFIARQPHRFWLDETIISWIGTQVSY